MSAEDSEFEYHPDLEGYVQTFIHTTSKMFGGMRKVVESHLKMTEDIHRQLEGRDDIAPELRTRVEERLIGYRLSLQVLEEKIVMVELFKKANSKEEGFVASLTKAAISAGSTMATGKSVPTAKDQITKFSALVQENGIFAELFTLSVDNDAVDKDLAGRTERDGTVTEENVVMAAAEQLKNGLNPNDDMDACRKVIEFFIDEIVDEVRQIKKDITDEECGIVRRTMLYLIGELNRDPAHPPPITRFDILVNLTVLCSTAMMFTTSMADPFMRDTLASINTYVGGLKLGKPEKKKRKPRHHRRK